MKGVKFKLWGQVAHFLQAAYSVYWATYPVPPRTVLQGIVGAILGMDKDTPQVALEDAHFAVSGAIPVIHHHTGNLRKNPVPSIKAKYSVAAMEKYRGRVGKHFKVQTTQIRQEWLFNPKFVVFAHLPEEYHDEFVRRLKNQEFVYSPYLGKTGMFACLEFLSEGEFEPLPEGQYEIETVVRNTRDTKLTLSSGMEIQSIVMPWAVDPERVFTTCPDPYLIQRDGKPIPVSTSDAYQFQGQPLMFL